MLPDCFSLSPFDETTLLFVFQKLSPKSFVRLRQTCKQMDALAESFKKRINIALFRIDICPRRYFPRSALYKREKIEQYRIDNIERMWLTVRPYKRSKKEITMKISEARLKLGCFCFEKVITGENPSVDIHPISLMEPNVYHEYMAFLKERSWRTSAAASFLTPKEILDIVRPRCLRLDGHLETIPSSVNTVVVARSKFCGEWNITDFPPSVKSFIVDDEFLNFEYMTRLLRDVVTAFCDDQLSLTFIQVKRVLVQRDVLLQRPSNPSGHPSRLDPCLLFRQHLIGTPYESLPTYPLFHSYIQPNAYIKKTVWVATSSLNVTSHSGKKSLLAVRMDEYGQNFYITLYFLGNMKGCLLPTVDYFEMEGDGIEWAPLKGNLYSEDESQGFCF